METTKTPGQQTLEPFVKGLECGQATGHLNLTLVPLGGEGDERLAYLLAAEALAAGQLSITEVSEGGSVPHLLAMNQADRPVLLLDGEELVGAKQNRILNTSVLLPPRSKTTVPVSCVEQGRWRDISRAFIAGSYSPAKLRARKSRDVTESYRREGAAHADQGAVWREVAQSLSALASSSPTMAMHDAVQQRRHTLEGYVHALPPPPGARGVVAAVNERFAALDLFDRPATLQAVWPRLLTGYAMDALAGHWRDPKGGPGAFSAKGAAELLRRLAELECELRPSVGVGQDWRFAAPDLVGQALVAEGACVHLCAFPAADAGEPRGGPDILPPSRRRQHTPPGAVY